MPMNRKSNRFMFDFLAPEIKLKFNGNHSFPTKVGMVMSLLCLSIFIYLTYYILKAYIDTSRPKVSVEIKNSAFKPMLNLTEMHIYPVLMFYDRVTSSYMSLEDMERYAHVAVYYIRYKKGEGETTYYPESQDIKIGRCGDLYDRGLKQVLSVEENDEATLNYFKTTAYCLDYEGNDIIVSKPGTSETFGEYLVVDYMPCVLGALCHPASDLANVTVATVLPKPIVNNGNYERPVKYFTLDEDYDYLSAGFQTIQKMKMVKSDIYDDRGVFSSESLRQTYLAKEETGLSILSRNSAKTSCLPSELFTPVCESYLQYGIIISTNTQKITREYKGLVESISEVGGMIELVFLVFSISYGFYHSRVYRDAMISAVYDVGIPRRSNMICLRNKVEIHAKEIIKEKETFKMLSNMIDEDINIVRITKELNNLRFAIPDPDNPNPIIRTDSLIEMKKRFYQQVSQGAGLSHKEQGLPTQTLAITERSNPLGGPKTRPLNQKTSILTKLRPKVLFPKSVMPQKEEENNSNSKLNLSQ